MTSKLKRHKAVNAIIAIAAMVFALYSCTPEGVVFHKYASPPDKEAWYSNDTVTLVLDTIAEDKDVEMDVGVRITEAYPLNDIVLHVTVEGHNHINILEGNVTINLFDETGKTATSGFPYMERSVKLSDTNLHLKKNHRYLIHINHNMRHNPLEGVSDVGVKLEIRK